jgi:hypothetical protein
MGQEVMPFSRPRLPPDKSSLLACVAAAARMDQMLSGVEHVLQVQPPDPALLVLLGCSRTADLRLPLVALPCPQPLRFSFALSGRRWVPTAPPSARPRCLLPWYCHMPVPMPAWGATMARLALMAGVYKERRMRVKGWRMRQRWREGSGGTGDGMRTPPCRRRVSVTRNLSVTANNVAAREQHLFTPLEKPCMQLERQGIPGSPRCAHSVEDICCCGEVPRGCAQRAERDAAACEADLVAEVLAHGFDSAGKPPAP